MILQLPQFVPNAFCFQCKGCCRFQDKKSPWRPRMSPQEARGYGSIQEDFYDEDLYFKVFLHQDIYQCHFLNPEDHRCRIYSHRPFECVLYPFLFIKEKDQLFFAVHLACPFIQDKRETEEFFQYLKTIKEVFLQCNQKEFQIDRFPAMKDGDFLKSEVDFLFPL